MLCLTVIFNCENYLKELKKYFKIVLGESIRFRVTSETFEESLPTGPPGTECPSKAIAPYRLIGGINEPGLGLLSWWESQGQEDEDDEQENDE